MAFKKINIEGSIDITDPFYRYTMVKLNVVRQKNKTVIDNLPAVCCDLERDPRMLFDYIKKRMSISMIYRDGIISTSADIKYNEVYEILREFIELFVLCEKCRLPETTINIMPNGKEKKYILDCKACSYITKKSM